MASKVFILAVVAMIITSLSAAPTSTKTDRSMTEKDKFEVFKTAVMTIQRLLDVGM